MEVIEDNNLAPRGFHIEELAWMKAKDKSLEKFASLGIWLDSLEGAEYIQPSCLFIIEIFLDKIIIGADECTLNIMTK